MRDLRKEKNLTQQEMADSVDLSINGYAKIERGECVPSAENLQKIAHVLGVDMDLLIRKNHISNGIMIIQDEGTGIHHSEVTNFYHSNNEDSIITILNAKIENLESIIQLKNKEIEYLKEFLAQKDKDIARLEEINQLLKSK